MTGDKKKEKYINDAKLKHLQNVHLFFEDQFIEKKG